MESDYEKRLIGSPCNSPMKAAMTATSPSTTPLKDAYGDRFVTRRGPASRGITFALPEPHQSQLLQAGSFGNAGNNAAATAATGAASAAATAAATAGKDGADTANMETYRALLRQELSSSSRVANINGAFAASAASAMGGGGGIGGGQRVISGAGMSEDGPPATAGAGGGQARVLMPRDTSGLLSFRSHRQSPHEFKTAPYMLSPIGDESQRILSSPKRQVRKIHKMPYKVLDAPDLLDDFYLNLVDWSSRNILSVGLGCCVYLWSAYTSQVTRLCDLGSGNDSVSSVAWSEKGDLVAVGTHRCQVQIWDVNTSEKIRTLEGHSGRVGALAWNGDVLASGSRDRTIRLWDHRRSGGGGSSGGFTRPGTSQRLMEHRQEVCGLKWSPDHQYLASGGNDNKLLVWSLGQTQPLLSYGDHAAAVKAIAWSPHQHGLLASGGGTADRCIRFWNTLTSQPLNCIDTGSQVCNIAWSKHSNELVTTHGYSQNQILLWKYPALTQIAKLTGHSCRVLYLAVSPDGESIVTGAGDETLRFWHVFSRAKQSKASHSQLGLFSGVR